MHSSVLQCWQTSQSHVLRNLQHFLEALLKQIQEQRSLLSLEFNIKEATAFNKMCFFQYLVHITVDANFQQQTVLIEKFWTGNIFFLPIYPFLITERKEGKRCSCGYRCWEWKINSYKTGKQITFLIALDGRIWCWIRSLQVLMSR